MIIRPATRADIPSMLLLTDNTPMASRWTRAQYERLYETDAPRRVTLICQEHREEDLRKEDGFAKKSSDEQHFDEQHNKVQGLITALVVADEWEIENVVVAVEVRRRGHATRLLRELIDMARVENARAIFLEVRESNTAARQLYKNAGFHETGRRPRYYSDPAEDAILYRHAIT
jgi:ribosomal-protein-alanine acetyltransferase